MLSITSWMSLNFHFLLRSQGWYLFGEDAADADDDEDVEDSRSHNSSYTYVSFCDKHPCKIYIYIYYYDLTVNAG